MLRVIRSKTIMLRLGLMSACFFCATFVFSGAMINSATISGNKYVNFAAMNLVAIPTRVITAFTLTRFGRKAPICVAYCFCTVFFIAAAFGPKCKLYRRYTVILSSWLRCTYYVGTSEIQFNVVSLISFS